MNGLVKALSFALLLGATASNASGQTADGDHASCADNPLALQILGSGGPIGVGRASAGYLVWIEGVGRIMVDAGGGTFLRLDQSGGRIADLDLLALSHFHPDHSTEVPALLWTERGNLRISGPTGSERFPSLDEYLDGLFGTGGVFRAVSDRMRFEPITIDTSKSEPSEVYSDGDLRVLGLGVPHGPVPAIGYRVDVGDLSIGFGSDQNGSDPAFAEFVKGVDYLVLHMAIPESAEGFGTQIHAKPSTLGQMASEAGVGTLVLSHLSRIAPAGAVIEGGRSLEEAISYVKSRYDGPLIVAQDLMCIPVG